VERIGFKNGMVLGFAVAAIGALLFYPASVWHQYNLFLAALFVVAIGIVLLQVAANPYITVLGPAKTASSRLTLIQGVGSIGTTTAPIFGAYFILSRLQTSDAPSKAVRYPYLGIALLLIVIAIVVYKLSLPVINSSSDKTNLSLKKEGSVFAFRNLNFGIVGIFMYVGAEVSIGTYLTNYISDTLHITVNEANSYVAFYWGGMLAGRLAGSYLLKIIKPSIVLSICAVAAVVLIVVSISSTGNTAVWTMIAVGLCNSIMFATIFSLAVSGLKRFTTRASGLLSTAIAGGAIVSFAQGVLKDNYAWNIAFILPLLCYMYILFYGLNGFKSKFAEV